LPQCPALSLVVLGGNLIGDEGAGALAQVLPKCPALSLLVLGGNRIGDEGAGQLQKCYRSAQRCLSWTSEAIG
jgi:Ran GTPase-activating protein (RanGAP) involved in mRNA processing and transport